MEHVFFAKFPRREVAESLLRELDTDGMSPRVSVDIVPRNMESTGGEMPLSISNTRGALVKGLVVGGLCGLVFGIALGAAGIGPGIPTSAGLAALFGALAGALGAVLTGASDPDANLAKLSARRQPGEVIVGFHAADLTTEEEVVARVRNAGGEIVPRVGHTMPPAPPARPAAT